MQSSKCLRRLFILHFELCIFNCIKEVFCKCSEDDAVRYVLVACLLGRLGAGLLGWGGEVEWGKATA